MTKKIALLLAAVFIVCSLSSCAQNGEESVAKTTELTTESTTVTTTEDTETKFAENSTSTIHDALKKDASGKYPYKLATYSTYYNAENETRTANITAALEKLNNLCIKNGETFSFNQTVGKRTVIAGYAEAKVVKDGEFVDGLGGGVCQISSTIFQCVLRANMKIVSRRAHSVEITYVPLGGDATVQWNSTDFQFKNNSGKDIRLELTAKNGKLTCTLYSKDKIDVGKVDIKIEKKNSTYILTRSVNGKTNYTTTSTYKKATTP